VTHDLLEPGDYMGFPIMRAGDWRRFSVEIRNRRGARKI
jgi:UDP-3-O-[3-hydroxymyristoyl] glucosamine N-acyltransferase